MEQVSTVSAGIMNTMLCISIAGIAIPVAAAVIFGKKLKVKAFPFLFGVIAFLIIDVVIRTLALNGLLSIQSFDTYFSNSPIAYQCLLAFTIVIFEEPIRYLLFKTNLKKYCSDYGAIAFGIGFGGAACIISCGIGMISNLITASAANAQVFETYTAEELSDLAAASQVIAAYKPVELITEFVRSIADIVIQVTFSFIIVRGIRFNTVLPCLLIALVGHFIYCAAPGLLSYAQSGAIIGTLFCSVMATCMIYYMSEAIKRYNYYKEHGNDI